MTEMPPVSAARIQFARCDGATEAASRCLAAANDAADFIDLRGRILKINEQYSAQLAEAADAITVEAMTGGE